MTAEKPPERIIARSIRKGDFVHGRKDKPPIEVLETKHEGKIVSLTLADNGRPLVLFRSDMVRVTLKEWA